MSDSAAPRKRSVAETVEPLMAEVAAAQAVELYDLEYVKEGGDRILRLYIDKEEGVDLNDCERVSRAAEAVLDASDPIPDAYVLEVSSPGVERRLRKDGHFARFIGAEVEVKLFKPVDGSKKYKGILRGLVEGAVALTDEKGMERRFDRQAVSLCRLVVFK